MNVVQHVLHPDDSASSLQFAAPPEDLDPAQVVLLRWGDTVSWCWETWDDHRVANAESVIFLVSYITLETDKRRYYEQTLIWLRHSDVDHSFAASTASSIAILVGMQILAIICLNRNPSVFSTNLYCLRFQLVPCQCL